MGREKGIERREKEEKKKRMKLYIINYLIVCFICCQEIVGACIRLIGRRILLGVQ